MSNMIKQAIEAVLADSDIKQAILEYLKSITVEPRQEWREIYHCQSESRAKHIELDVLTGQENFDRDYRLFMRVHYSESGSVGRITLFEYDARLFEPRYFRDNDYWFWGKADEIILVLEPDPFKAIDRALELWPERKAAFENAAVIEKAV